MASVAHNTVRQDYRPDIDGLRAVSVLAVVFYHFQIPYVSGGFVGVDVFFVISGYLITSHLFRDIERNGLSILSFYDRRFRRIIPALIPPLLLSLILGYFLLMPGDYETLARSGIYSAIGAANIFFLQNTGYFDQAADFMPLLHMWSLGVEEQFYLVWPLILGGTALLSRNSKSAIVALLVAIILTSFLGSLYTLQDDATAAFFRPDTRAWELGLGAILVFLPRMRGRWLAEAACALGIILILFGIFTLDQQSLFPGMNALYPTVGAALIIWPKDKMPVVARALSWRPAVFVGLISYSLYLWHWPILVFFRVYNSSFFPTLAQSLILIAIAVGFAIASYYFVEQPGRRVKLNRTATVAAGATGIAIMAAANFSVAFANGFPQRLSGPSASLSSLRVMWQWPGCRPASIPGLKKTGCYFGEEWSTARKKVFLWGDSHAEHLAPILETIMKQQGAAGIVFQGCAPSLGGGVHRYQPSKPEQFERCRSTYGPIVSYLRAQQDIDHIFLAAAWTGKIESLYTSDPGQRSIDQGRILLTQSLVDLAAEISAPSRTIVIVGPTPIWSTPNPLDCAIADLGELSRIKCTPEQKSIPSAEFKTRSRQEVAALQKAALTIPRARFINPSDALCDGPNCVVTMNDEFLYRDTGHFRRNLKPETLRMLADRMHLEVGLQ